MKPITAATRTYGVEFDRQELLIIHAALNEVCNGIALFEFETRMGAKREEVARLLEETGRLLDAPR